MPALREIALVSDDLLFQSQLSRVLVAGGGHLVRVAGEAIPGGAEAVFVDLNERSEERVARIRSLRAERPDATIVGFCHHGEHEVRRRAMAAGADQVLTNGGLQTGALRITGLSSAVATNETGDG
ncbi:MAG: hypothetical protein ABR541_01550 [Candidatus Dormibacteria bacterium]